MDKNINKRVCLIMRRLKSLFHSNKIYQAIEKDSEIIVSDRTGNAYSFTKNKYGLDNLELFVMSKESKK